ncbi:NADH dehydrogenase [ubiquinone] 1 alpha subcomplex subunit 2 [Glycine max]|nr:NADH dehydrogenase [ubiquinone] 1 alpha subcomplex subunit 2 [Glycine max]
MVSPQFGPESHLTTTSLSRLRPCNLGSNGMERKSFEKHKRTSSSPASSPTRAFVERNYKELKTLNPKLPILIRECSGVEPQLWARYDLGVEKGIKLEGLSEAQIFKALEDLVKAGQSMKA